MVAANPIPPNPHIFGGRDFGQYVPIWDLARLLAAAANKDPRPSLRRNFGRLPNSSNRALRQLLLDVRQFSGLSNSGKNDGLVGVGVGLSEMGDKPVLRLLVANDRAYKIFRKHQQAWIPSVEPGIIEVEVAGRPRAQLTGHYRPAAGGCSIGHHAVNGGGSIACLVNNGSGEFILSARHVMAPLNATIGDQIHQPAIGFPNSQPIAPLAAFTPFHGKPNSDAAIAGPVHNGLCQSGLHPAGVHPAGAVGPVRFPRINERIKLRGAGSGGDIHGKFDMFLSSIHLLLPGFGVVTFFDFGRAVMNTSSGDSGALVLSDEDGSSLGVHTGAFGRYSYFSLMPYVVHGLGITPA